MSGIPLNPNAKVGGTLVRAYFQEGPTYSQWEEKSNIWAEHGQPLTNNLVRYRSWGTVDDYKNGAYFELKPELAQSWEQSKDGLQWTFKLRQGVTFSDGKPLTCGDVKWSLDTIRTGEGLKRSVYGSQFITVDTVQCADDYTAVLNLKRPKPALLDLMAIPNIVIMPKHVYEKDTEALRTKPNVGSGPFVLKSFTVQEKYILERNPTYWDKPFPYLDGIEMVFLAQSAIPAALRAGRVDWGSLSSVFRGGQTDTLVKECDRCQVWPSYPSMGFSVAIVNHQRPPWNRPEIKDALSLALDRDKLAKLLKADPPVGGPFFPGSFWELPKDRLAQIPGYNFADPEGNKAKARELLAKAGFKPGELVLPLDIGVYNAADAPPMVEDLIAAGFKVNVQNYEVGRTYEKLGNAEFEVMVAGFAGNFDPDFNLYEFFYTGSERNYGRYSNVNFDRLVDEMSITIDPEQRRRKAWDAAEIALRDQAMILTVKGASTPIFAKRVQGWLPNPFFGSTQRFDHAWLSAE